MEASKIHRSWRVVDIFFTLILYVALLFVFVVFTKGLFGSGIDDRSITARLLAEDIFDALILSFLPILLVVKGYRARLAEIGLHTQSLVRNFVTGVIAGTVIWGVVFVFDAAIEALIGPIKLHPYLERLNGATSLFGQVVVMFSIVVLAPISEEIYFRGFVYTILRKNYGVAIGILVSSILFSIVHFDSFSVTQVLIAGVGFAFLFHLTRSLVPSIVAHTTFNLLTIFVSR